MSTCSPPLPPSPPEQCPVGRSTSAPRPPDVRPVLEPGAEVPAARRSQHLATVAEQPCRGGRLACLPGRRRRGHEQRRRSACSSRLEQGTYRLGWSVVIPRRLAEMVRLVPPPGRDIELPATELRRGMWIKDPGTSAWRRIRRAVLVDELISQVTCRDGVWAPTGYRQPLVFIRVDLAWGGQLDLNLPARVLARDYATARRAPSPPR